VTDGHEFGEDCGLEPSAELVLQPGIVMDRSFRSVVDAANGRRVLTVASVT
jgi:hypothetical protein